MSVRFVDPNTNGIVYPEPFETPTNTITPGLGTNVPQDGALILNPLLVAATISWDVRHPFRTCVEQWPQAERDRVAQSATLPPTRRLEFRSRYLPWGIEVLPGTSNLCVTVFDVLATIELALRPQITPEEWNTLNTAWKQMIVAARATRAQEYDPDRQANEMYKHPRRVDCLGEFTQFEGLVPAPRRSPDSLDLKLKRRR